MKVAVPGAGSFSLAKTDVDILAPRSPDSSQLLPNQQLVPDLEHADRVLVITEFPKRSFDEDMLKYPRFEFWDKEQTPRKGELPKNVKLVFMTRFLSHAVAERVRDLCRRSGALCYPGLVSTGFIKTHLRRFMNWSGDDSPELPALSSTKEWGMLVTFFRQNLDHRADYVAEKERLKELAVTQSFVKDLRTFDKCFASVRAKLAAEQKQREQDEVTELQRQERQRLEREELLLKALEQIEDPLPAPPAPVEAFFYGTIDTLCPLPWRYNEVTSMPMIRLMAEQQARS